MRVHFSAAETVSSWSPGNRSWRKEDALQIDGWDHVTTLELLFPLQGIVINAEDNGPNVAIKSEPLPFL